MKLLLSILSHLIFLTVASAQYQPLLEEDKHWVFLTHQANDAGVNILSGFIVNIKGDTLIGGKVYKKLYSYNLIGRHNCQIPPCFTPNDPYEIEKGKLYAIMREDALNGIVYHLNPNANTCNEEYELFNFQQNVGDTLDSCVRDRILFEEEDGIVDSISTINIYNAEREVIYTTGDIIFEGLEFSDKLEIIEGIGFGLYGFIPGTQDELVEVCFGTLSECNILSSTSSITIEPSIKLYPNPATNLLNIDSQFEISRIVITNPNGQLVYDGNESNINTSFLNSGVYFVDIILKNNKMHRTKFVKIY